MVVDTVIVWKRSKALRPTCVGLGLHQDKFLKQYIYIGLMLVPIAEIGFQSELFGLIVVRTIIGHSPGLGGGGGLPKQRCSSCFGFKNSKN